MPNREPFNGLCIEDHVYFRRRPEIKAKVVGLCHVAGIEKVIVSTTKSFVAQFTGNYAEDRSYLVERPSDLVRDE